MSPLQEVPGECEWGSLRAKIGSILALQRSKENKSQANEVEPQHEFSRERVLVQGTQESQRSMPGRFVCVRSIGHLYVVDQHAGMQEAHA